MGGENCERYLKRQALINRVFGWSALWCSVVFALFYFVQAGGPVFDLRAFVSWCIPCAGSMWCARIFFQSEAGWKRILEGKFPMK